ncbi:bpX5 domain-containing protein [Lentzea sp. NPDC004789]
MRPLTWTRREPPLAPAAVAGGADLRAAAVRRLREGAELRVACGPEWILVVGGDLPWADGVTYLGWDDGLLVPTTLAPSTPAGLLRHALPADVLAVLPGAVLTGPAPVRAADPERLVAVRANDLERPA